jgi:hypothetical protein
LEKVLKDASSLWADPRLHSAVVLLQDRAQHIGEAVDGCQKSLTTMYSVMLPRNPLSGSFTQLLDVFRSSQRIHWLIELNLVAGANFALGWIRKWHPRLNYSSMSLGFPQGGVRLQSLYGCLIASVVIMKMTDQLGTQEEGMMSTAASFPQ